MANNEKSNEYFFLSYIENSKDGKPNWEKIVQDCALPTVNAARLKLGRLRAKFGGSGGRGNIHAVTNGESHSPSKVTKVTGKTAPKAGKGRPRKIKDSSVTQDELASEMLTGTNGDDDKSQTEDHKIKDESDFEV